jgi:N-acetylglucosamine repressor
MRVTPAPSVVRPALLSRMNEQTVLRVIQETGPLSRIDVARRTGITAPTASKAVDSLLRLGWLEEDTTALEPARGRPARRVRLTGESAQVIGVVIDATECRVVAAGLDGTIRDAESGAFPTPAMYDDLIKTIVEHASALIARPGAKTFGVGISIPGLLDYDEQRVLVSPNVPQTDGRSPVRDLAARLQLPCVQYHEENALCLAERYFGSARTLDSFAILDVSTGVGLGVMSGGRLLTGQRGVAGEIGHFTVVPDGGRLCGCGNHGCLETEASDTALARAVGERSGRALTIQEVVALAGAGEISADAEIERCCCFLGIGVAAVLNLFSVSTLFIHGHMFEIAPGVFDRLLAEVERRALAPSFRGCRIVQARSSKRLGAVAGIIDHLVTQLVPQSPASTRSATHETRFAVAPAPL